ncbi:MAG: hypothetical protein QXR81_07605 [Candidatus Nezhaarchaeales archaeon]
MRLGRSLTETHPEYCSLRGRELIPHMTVESMKCGQSSWKVELYDEGLLLTCLRCGGTMGFRPSPLFLDTCPKYAKTVMPAEVM